METHTDQPDRHRLASWRATLLRKLFPDGIEPQHYEQALHDLDVAERISQPVAQTNIEKATPPRDPALLSRGARRLMDTIQKHPGISIEELGKKLPYNRTYVYGLISELRRKGYTLEAKIDAVTGFAKYFLPRSPERQNAEH